MILNKLHNYKNDSMVKKLQQLITNDKKEYVIEIEDNVCFRLFLYGIDVHGTLNPKEKTDYVNIKTKLSPISEEYREIIGKIAQIFSGYKHLS